MDADLLPVLVHIQTGLETDLSAAALAHRTGWSESTLHRRILEATGETPRAHVERLRLERAGAQLMLRQSTILEVALDNGFASHEVFTRAFRRHFKTSPSEWRDRQAAGGLGQHERQPGLSETAEGISLSSTRLTELHDIEIAFLRDIGPYDQIDGGMWGRVRDRLAELGHSTDGLPVGIGQDAPQITPPERCRFDAGWTIDATLPAECGLGQQTISGGTYAITTYVGPFSKIGFAYELISQRLMAQPDLFDVETGDFRGPVEWYRTGSIDAETYLNQVDISFPVAPRAGSPRVFE
jgi:AraC family transcriptional regulator